MNYQSNEQELQFRLTKSHIILAGQLAGMNGDIEVVLKHFDDVAGQIIHQYISSSKISQQEVEEMYEKICRKLGILVQ